MARRVLTPPSQPPVFDRTRVYLTEPSGDDWEQCRRVAYAHGRTFYLACQLLPLPSRRAVHATYAWCRTADDIVDTMAPTDGAAAHIALDRWLRSIEEPFDPISRTFAWVVQHHDITTQAAEDLISGVRMDLETPRFRTWDELRHYSYCVAGTVGLMTAPLLGCTDNSALPHAIDLGVAMQLTNILRDVAEDAAIGRVYLPDEDLERFGVSRESLLRLEPDGDFRGLMQFEIERARGLYRRAHAGIGSLSASGQLATIAGSNLYRAILRQIEAQDYDVFCQRATVNTHQKLREMPAVFAMFLRLQWGTLGNRLRA